MGYWHPMPMWQIQQNPPLASYYMAMVASIGGWSERALHLGFILPALAVILARIISHYDSPRNPYLQQQLLS